MPKVTITNKRNLPVPLVNAVSHSDHVMIGDISVTSLIDSPRLRVLKKLMPEREEDASDRMWMLYGSAIHNILQHSDPTARIAMAFNTVIKELQSTKDNEQFASAANWLKKIKPSIVKEEEGRYMCEKTLVASVTTKHGEYTICGTIDLYDREMKAIQDYKLCSTYKWTQPHSQVQWIKQLSVYEWLLEKNGLPVEKKQIIPMFRDWTANSSLNAKIKQREYPDAQVVVIDLPNYIHGTSREEYLQKLEAWIITMVEDHQMADKGEPRDCTGQERWTTADSYKVYSFSMVDGKKHYTTERASRVCDSQEEAEEWIEKAKYRLKPGLQYEVRRVEGESRRCEDYCPVFSECPQMKSGKHTLPKKNDWDKAKAMEHKDNTIFYER